MQLKKYLPKNRMTQLQICLALLLLFSLKFANTQSGKEGQLRMTPNEIMAASSKGSKAPGSSNLEAVQVIVIHGDPSKGGLYTILLKVAAKTKIPAHLHPDEYLSSRRSHIESGLPA